MANTTLKTKYGTMDIEAFIVPNKACPAKSFWLSSEKKAARAAEICELNKITYNEETDNLVQLWCIGGESDNMQDHGFSYTEGNLKYRFRFDSVLPANLFTGYKEGEVVSVKISMTPCLVYELGEGEDFPRRRIYADYEEEEIEAPQFVFTFNIKLNQISYRYSRFGNFEDVLEQVCR